MRRLVEVAVFLVSVVCLEEGLVGMVSDVVEVAVGGVVLVRLIV